MTMSPVTLIIVLMPLINGSITIISATPSSDTPIVPSKTGRIVMAPPATPAVPSGAIVAKNTNSM